MAKPDTTRGEGLCERVGCGNALSGRQRRFCSGRCSAIWRHEQRKAQEVATADALIREQLEPVVREALTEEVLKELGAWVKELPTAFRVLQAQMVQQEDPVLAQKAAELLLKYTLGNRSIAPAPEEKSQDIQIVFGLPQQGEKVDAANSTIDVSAVEIADPERECMECSEWKAPDDFVGASNRCKACDDKMRAKLADRFPGLMPASHAPE